MVEWLPKAEDVNVNAYGIRLARERRWYTIFPSFLRLLDLSRLLG
jgi:hypothetical protein